MNTNSNTYTIAYASIMVVIVAFLLAFVSSSLKPTQEKNVELDKKKQILSALNIRHLESNDAVEAKYNEVVLADMIINAEGKVLNEGTEKDKAGFTVANKDVRSSYDRTRTLGRPLGLCGCEEYQGSHRLWCLLLS